MGRTTDNKALILIDAPTREIITVTVFDGAEIVAQREISYEGPVDSKLLTTVDNLFQEHILDRFRSIVVKPGEGIDKTSLLYRIIVTFGAALERSG